MQSPSTRTAFPTDTFTPDVEDHEVKRLDEGVTDMTGPVVVGGRHCADCFWDERQAGVKDAPMTLEDFNSDTPRTRPW